MLLTSMLFPSVTGWLNIDLVIQPSPLIKYVRWRQWKRSTSVYLLSLRGRYSLCQQSSGTQWARQHFLEQITEDIMWKDASFFAWKGHFFHMFVFLHLYMNLEPVTSLTNPSLLWLKVELHNVVDTAIKKSQKIHLLPVLWQEGQ